MHMQQNYVLIVPQSSHLQLPIGEVLKHAQYDNGRVLAVYV